jgi:cholinesterase
MEWAQKYIHLFGGDPRRVTIAGESAGGASVIHHITARGGSGGPPPFQKALIQSSGWNPITNTSHLERVYKDFLKALGVDSL